LIRSYLCEFIKDWNYEEEYVHEYDAFRKFLERKVFLQEGKQVSWENFISFCQYLYLFKKNSVNKSSLQQEEELTALLAKLQSLPQIASPIWFKAQIEELLDGL